ncbi:MAG: ABC transporter, permease protein 2 (cluster 5, nickel/peptides/opines), partial [uncultured Acetobacteraceae bacterium]
ERHRRPGAHGRRRPGPDGRRGRTRGAGAAGLHANPRLLGRSVAPGAARPRDHRLRARAAPDAAGDRVRAADRAPRPLPGQHDSAAARHRHAQLPARHGRAGAGHPDAPALRRAALVVHRHRAGGAGLLHRHEPRRGGGLRRRAREHAHHADHRRLLRLPLRAACGGHLRRARGGHLQRHPGADPGVRAAHHPRGGERDPRSPQPRLRGCGAGLRRRRLHRGAGPRAGQRAGADLRVRDLAHFSVHDPGVGPVLPRPRHQAAGAGMGADAEHAPHGDLRAALGGGAAGGVHLRHLHLLQPAERWPAAGDGRERI